MKQREAQHRPQRRSEAARHAGVAHQFAAPRLWHDVGVDGRHRGGAAGPAEAMEHAKRQHEQNRRRPQIAQLAGDEKRDAVEQKRLAADTVDEQADGDAHHRRSDREHRHHRADDGGRRAEGDQIERQQRPGDMMGEKNPEAAQPGENEILEPRVGLMMLARMLHWLSMGRFDLAVGVIQSQLREFRILERFLHQKARRAQSSESNFPKPSCPSCLRGGSSVFVTTAAYCEISRCKLSGVLTE